MRCAKRFVTFRKEQYAKHCYWYEFPTVIIEMHGDSPVNVNVDSIFERKEEADRVVIEIIFLLVVITEEKKHLIKLIILLLYLLQSREFEDFLCLRTREEGKCSYLPVLT